MDNMYFDSRLVVKFIGLLLWLVFAILVSAWVAWQPVSQMISHNPQGEFCHYIASARMLPVEGKDSFIKINNKYIRYNEHEHKNYKIFYVEYDGEDIETANWETEGYPCRLTGETLVIFGGIFSAIFLFLALITYGLIKTKDD